jgi:hypothetical protein
MSQEQEFSDIAKAIIDSNLYMVLGTADKSGQPWVSPVYYAAAEYKAFYWVSSIETQHSLNLATRQQLSIVIYDSHAQIGTGQAVYMSAHAEILTGSELDRGLDIYSRSALNHGGIAWSKENALPPARHRLYRATASEQWILDPTASIDERIQVML